MTPDEALGILAGESYQYARIVRDELNRLRAALAEREWRPIESAPRDKPALVAFANEHGKWRRIKAIYLSAKTHVDDGDFSEYDEETDESYAPEGWYEDIYSDTGLDYNRIFLHEQPTHWMPLPGPPK